jgi:hypothetical protein
LARRERGEKEPVLGLFSLMVLIPIFLVVSNKG